MFLPQRNKPLTCSSEPDTTQANCYTARCSIQLIIYPSPCPAANKPFALMPQDNDKKAIAAK